MQSVHGYRRGDGAGQGGGVVPEAPFPSLVSLPHNPVPTGASVGLFHGFDGTQLRYAHWPATRGPRRGTVCIFPGRSEFIEKYLETVGDLRRRGLAVAIMDWRGQGGSERALADKRKGHVRDFSEYDRDLRCFMREVVLPDCPPPYFALAHSMGGNILLRNAVEPGTWFERMILTAPMIELTKERLAGYPAWAVEAYARTASLAGQRASYVLGGGPEPIDIAGFEGNVLTGDRERFERNRMLMRAAPALLIGDPTVEWLAAAFRSMRRLQAADYPSRVIVPLLIFTAGADRIVRPRAVEDFAARLKVGASVLLETSRHEVLQERDDIRARFWAAFDAYLGIRA
ncbi:MAG: alpha/beta hydrolase [Hyphomicrobiaceae bacterium]